MTFMESPWMFMADNSIMSPVADWHGPVSSANPHLEPTGQREHRRLLQERQTCRGRREEVGCQAMPQWGREILL